MDLKAQKDKRDARMQAKKDAIGSYASNEVDAIAKDKVVEEKAK